MEGLIISLGVFIAITSIILYSAYTWKKEQENNGRVS